MRPEIQKAIDLLGSKSIDCSVKNNGVHLIVTLFSGTKVDFYPTTGKWIVRGGKTSEGLNNLIRYNEIEATY